MAVVCLVVQVHLQQFRELLEKNRVLEEERDSLNREISCLEVDEIAATDSQMNLLNEEKEIDRGIAEST